MEELRTRRALEALQNGHQSVRIQYENGEGEVSQRIIVPLEFYERWGNNYVRTYCYLRHERRTFALRRLQIVEGQAHILAAPPETRNPTPSPRAAPPRPVEKNTTAAAKNTGSSGLAEFFRLSFTIAGLAVILWALLSSGVLTEYLSDGAGGSRADESESYQADRAHGSDGGRAERSTAPTPPASWTYRGYRLSRSSSGRITAAQLGRSFNSGRQAHYWINSHLFYQRTGLTNGQLLARYMGADTDRNGHLSWREVEAFQRQTYRLFTYRANHRALPPDEFLAQQGGDCEDFALYTCGLLEFWGWNSKVASFYPPGGGSGHALAMVWSARPINGYGYIHVSGEADQNGSLTEVAYTTAYLRPGYWIPIDYDSIGRFSDAMSSNWTLWDLSDPVELYGAIM
ncbi:MAG: WYL domain-containing protein [Spirochaetia bacterium]|nr:WYL domain-containing protein [Spirochaetia bacterium]